MFFYILDDLAAYDELWIVGDNFVAETYRAHFKLVDPENLYKFYMRKYFDIVPYCNSRHNSVDTNLLSRIRNTIAHGINERGKLPKFMVCALDSDVINYLDFRNAGTAALLGEMMSWLINEVENMITTRKKQLISKLVKEDYPQVYWVASPAHNYFADHELRRKFNLCMESILKSKANM